MPLHIGTSEDNSMLILLMIRQVLSSHSNSTSRRKASSVYQYDKTPICYKYHTLQCTVFLNTDRKKFDLVGEEAALCLLSMNAGNHGLGGTGNLGRRLASSWPACSWLRLRCTTPVVLDMLECVLLGTCSVQINITMHLHDTKLCPVLGGE